MSFEMEALILIVGTGLFVFFWVKMLEYVNKE
jgi:hypothetical protein